MVTKTWPCSPLLHPSPTAMPMNSAMRGSMDSAPKRPGIRASWSPAFRSPALTSPRLDVRAEDFGDGNQVAVLADDLDHRPADEIPDRDRAFGRGDQSVAGDAGIAGVDPGRVRAGVPVVHRGVELHAGVAAGPGRLGD